MLATAGNEGLWEVSDKYVGIFPLLQVYIYLHEHGKFFKPFVCRIYDTMAKIRIPGTLLLLGLLVTLYLPQVAACFYIIYDKPVIHPILFIGITNFPINLTILVFLLMGIRIVDVHIVKSMRRVYLGLLAIVLLCTCIGAFVNYYLLYDFTGSILRFNPIYWSIGIFIIIYSYFFPLLFWTRNKYVAVFISILIGALNLFSWMLLLCFNNELIILKDTFWTWYALVFSGYIASTLLLMVYCKLNNKSLNKRIDDLILLRNKLENLNKLTGSD